MVMPGGPSLVAMRGHLVRRGDAWRVQVYVGRDEVTGKQRS